MTHTTALSAKELSEWKANLRNKKNLLTELCFSTEVEIPIEDVIRLISQIESLTEKCDRQERALNLIYEGLRRATEENPLMDDLHLLRNLLRQVQIGVDVILKNSTDENLKGDE